MPLYLVQLDDCNMSHPYLEEEVVADNPELAGQKALDIHHEMSCGTEHAKELEDDGFGEQCCKICGGKPELFEIASIEQISLDQVERIGILTPSGTLLDASECNSQIEGSPFDGPCLWPDLDSAKNDNDDYGGLADDHKYVRVTLTINEIKEDDDGD